MLRPTIAYTYEPFSREPEYVDVNERFVRSLELERRGRVLDLACGTGTLSAMMPGVRFVVGIDLSREALGLAREYLRECAQAPDRVGYVHASADALPLADGSVEAVVIGNAIQLVDDKDVLAREVARVLRPGGLFAFNTSFYAGSYVDGTEAFYRRWLQEALRYVESVDAEMRRHDGRGVVRKKGQARPAFSNRWLSAGEYAELLDRHGMVVRRTGERTVMLTQRCFESIGAYAGMASVLLSGYPVELACEALVAAAGPALQAAQADAIPRRWMEMVAVRR
jgi:ubiquinone/menaquinone biosynthesis C-methylase UbiE